MLKFPHLSGIILLLLPIFAQAQTTSHTHRKGQFFAYWGWNRATYTKSDLHFTGTNYDFTLDNVVAKDRQTRFDPKVYFHPTKLTIPQTNFRIGYFIRDHYHITFGFDHMKYVMQQDQTVKITGSIKDTDTQYDGEYDQSDIVLAKKFLLYEHTDGLNYLNLEFGRSDEIHYFPRLHTQIGLTESIGAGVLMPRSDVTLLRNKRHDKYNIAGFGTSVKAGLNLTFFRYFFLQTELKIGFINMPHVRTTFSRTDKASQSFWFLQRNFVFGGHFFL